MHRGMRLGMFAGMTRLTITVPDDLADQIRRAAGDNMSAWAAKSLREALLRQEAQAVAVYEREHGDDAWEAERARQFAS